jgi:hypothetical protein
MSAPQEPRAESEMTASELVDMAWFCADGGLLFSAALWLREAADKLEAQARLRSAPIVSPVEPVT